MRVLIALLCIAALVAVDLSAQTSPYSYDENWRPEQEPALQNLKPGRDSLLAMAPRQMEFTGAPKLANQGGWSDMFTVPGVVDGYLYTMATDGTNLYIGGLFTVIGGTVANNVARWDGQRWHSLGTGTENGVTGSVEAMAWIDGKLFVGGQVDKAGSTQVNGIAYWDGDEWRSLGIGDTNGIRTIHRFPDSSIYVGRGHVWALHANNDMVYVGGSMNLVGADTAQGMAGWRVSTGEWVNFNGGLSSKETLTLVYGMSFAGGGDELYVGGQFDHAGGVPAKNIAKWNGTGWEAVGGGTDDWVRGMDLDEEGNLFISGFFRHAGELSVSGVAKWDGTAWSTLGDVSVVEPGSDYYPDVRYTRIIDGKVFISGGFDYLNDTPATGFAQWDGSQWKVIDGLGFTHLLWSGKARTFMKVGGKMYVGGDFKTAHNLLVSNLVMWDEETSSWELISDGSADKGLFDGFAYAVSGSDKGTYIGGSFSAAGQVYTKNIAKWDGNNWDHLSMGYINGIKGTVYAVLVDGENVFVGGRFGFAGSVEAYHVAQWDGTEWHSIGIGVGGVSGAMVETLLKIGDYLYVGGHFALVGDEENYALPANSVARFNLVTRRWESVGLGMEYVQGYPGFVDVLAYDGTTLYAGGLFRLADGKDSWGIATWNDAEWLPIGEPGFEGVDGRVMAMKQDGNGMLIGGAFTLPGRDDINWLARLENGEWSDFGGGVSSLNGFGGVLAIERYQQSLVVAGLFEYAGDSPASNIAEWDGEQWIKMDGGTNNSISGLSVDGDKLIAVGSFTIAGGKPSVSVAQYERAITTDVEGAPGGIPNGYVLHQNYPNPFNPTTNILFSLPAASEVRITVYDLLGRELHVLLNERRSAGNHAVQFNAAGLPSGTYYYRLQAGEHTTVRPMVLMK